MDAPWDAVGDDEACCVILCMTLGLYRTTVDRISRLKLTGICLLLPAGISAEILRGYVGLCCGPGGCRWRDSWT